MPGQASIEVHGIKESSISKPIDLPDRATASSDYSTEAVSTNRYAMNVLKVFRISFSDDTSKARR